MARGTSLAVLRSMLKAEIGDFASANATRDAQLNALLSNKQKLLATEHYWPFLERHWDVTATANTQYLSLPTTTAGDPEVVVLAIDLDTLPKVEVLYNNIYQPVINGIGEDEYNTFNFSLGQQSDPILRWRLATNPNEPDDPNQFEVWPVPVTEQTLRFTGERAIQALTTDGNTADLDDLLIVLFVAADILARQKQADAQVKFQAAQRRLQWLRQGYEAKVTRRTMDGRDMSKTERKIIMATVFGSGGAAGQGRTNAGVGSPEGVLVGNPGDTYVDTSNNWFYVKTSGIGTKTGWQLLLGNP